MTRPADYQKYRSDRQIERILAAIADAPMTAKQLADQISVTVSCILIYTKRLMAEPRQIHIAGHAPSPKGKPSPLYGPGDRPNVEYTPKRKPKQGNRVEMQIDRVTKALATPCTADQLGAKIHLTRSRARFYIRELRLAKLAYIASWDAPPGRGDLSPVYALGSKRDKKKPRQTRAERYRIEKADPDKHERSLAKRRARHHSAKAASKPNTWLSALGVRP